MFRIQITKHPGLREHMAYYDRLPEGHAEKTYDYLLQIVRQHLELQRRNQARSELQKGMKSVPAAPLTRKGVCYQFRKNGKCSRGDACPFDHGNGGEGRPSAKSTSPSLKGKGKGGKNKSRSPSPEQRSKSPGTKKVTCTFYLKGTCTNGDQCTFAHPKPCLFYAKGACSRGNKCLFAHIQKSQPATPAGTEPDQAKNPGQTRNCGQTLNRGQSQCL